MDSKAIDRLVFGRDGAGSSTSEEDEDDDIESVEVSEDFEDLDQEERVLQRAIMRNLLMRHKSKRVTDLNPANRVFRDVEDEAGLSGFQGFSIYKKGHGAKSSLLNDEQKELLSPSNPTSRKTFTDAA